MPKNSRQQFMAIGVHAFAGGFTLGMTQAGFRVKAHLEDGSFGADTSELNFPGLRTFRDQGTWPDWLTADVVFANPPCLLPYESVLTEDHGWVKIINLVRSKYGGKVACVINGEMSYSSVTDWHENPYSGDILEVSLIGFSTYAKSVKVTANHRFLTQRGWVEAKCLTDNDLVATGEPVPTNTQKEMIDGAMLGDAKVSIQPQFITSQCDQELVRLKAVVLQSLDVKTCLVKNSKKAWSDGAARKDQLCLYAKTYEWVRTERKRWYPNGVKIVPADLKLTDMTLATWMMDDGHGVKTTWSNKEEYRSRRTVGSWASLAVHGFSPTNQRLLIKKLAEVGLIGQLKSRKSGFVDLGIKGKSADEFFKRIARYVPPSMRYKIPPGLEEFDPDLWKAHPAKTGWSNVSVKKIKTSRNSKVYCLGVKGSENFVTRGGVTHNCSPWSTAGIVKGLSTEDQNDWRSHPKTHCVASAFDQLKQLKPLIWCFESVRQAYTKGKDMLDDMAAEAMGLGYSVTDLFTEARNHGIPQHRKRYFMVCHKIEISWLRPSTPEKSVYEALSDVDYADDFCGKMPSSIEAICELIGQGENARMAWDRAMEAEVPLTSKRPAFIYDRMAGDRPSYTLLGSCNKLHPVENRMLSVNETKVLCGFPASYQLTGNMTDRYAQLGKGVCPPVAKWLGEQFHAALILKTLVEQPVRKFVTIESSIPREKKPCRNPRIPSPPRNQLKPR